MLKGWILGFLRQFGYTALRIAYLEAERADHRRALDAEAGLQGEHSRFSAELAEARAQRATLTRERDEARAREDALARALSEVRSRAADADAARERLRADLTAREGELADLRGEISDLRAEAAAAGADLQRLRTDLAKAERDLSDRRNELMHATGALRLLRAKQTLAARHGNGATDIQADEDKWPVDSAGPPDDEALSDKGGDGLREPPALPYAAGQSFGVSGVRDGLPLPDDEGAPVMDRRIVDILADHEQTLQELAGAYGELEELRHRIASDGQSGMDFRPLPRD